MGVAVTDLLKERRLRLTAVTIHGEEKVTHTNGTYNVPKGDLVAALEVPFHKGALKVAEGLTLWGVLREELQNFRRKINLKTAHASYEHWREGTMTTSCSRALLRVGAPLPGAGRELCGSFGRLVPI